MTTPQVPLAHFRAECYQTFGRRRDSLFDLLDALLTSERPASLVRLSLAPGFRRCWSSLFDALSDGQIDLAALSRVWVRSLPPPAPDTRPLWALDGSTWPRPEARTSPERTCCRFVTAGVPESGIVPGWEYQWLVAIPETQGSWVVPLAITRRGPAAGTPTALAIAQLRATLATYPVDAPRPLVAMDSHYDVPTLVRAHLGVDWLARLASNRRFYRVPPPYTGSGRPRTHGAVLRLADPTTQHDPERVQVEDDPAYGAVTLTLWTQVHTQRAPTVPVDVLRITVAHLPRRSTPPAPLWLAWHGTSIPVDLRELWRAYQRRFTVEHAFRFCKQDLGWTRPRLRWPAAADRWSALVGIALWQLWLGRDQVADARLPWEHAPLPGYALSPGRVRRRMGSLLGTMGSPARSPRPRGNAPGRRPGDRPGRAARFPTQRRGPPAAS